jgi:hypothetical protein
MPQFGRERAEIKAASLVIRHGLLRHTMFLEDEFAARRLRANRVSSSLLVAFVALMAAMLMSFGLVSAACAEEFQQSGPATTDVVALAATPMATAQTMKAVGLLTQGPTSMKMPRTAARADEQILRGVTMLLLALTAASGLAIWRRRVRGVLKGAMRNVR